MVFKDAVGHIFSCSYFDSCLGPLTHLYQSSYDRLNFIFFYFWINSLAFSKYLIRLKSLCQFLRLRFKLSCLL